MSNVNVMRINKSILHHMTQKRIVFQYVSWKRYFFNAYTNKLNFKGYEGTYMLLHIRVIQSSSFHKPNLTILLEWSEGKAVMDKLTD